MTTSGAVNGEPLEPKANHYRMYKDDTNCLASYLAITARACGYSAGRQAQQASQSKGTGRLKGKLRKQQQEAEQQPTGASHMITRDDLLILAKHIAAARPRVIVPQSIIRLIQRIIALRKRHSTWYAQLPSQSEEHHKSNLAHQGFIGILEIVLEVLKPACVDSPSREPENPSGIELTNLFDNLHVETPSEAFLNEPVKRHREQDTSATYVAEQPQSPYEKDLAAHCVFLDLLDIRKAVREVWEMFAADRASLIPCSLMTFAAVRVADQIQKEFEQDAGGPLDFEVVTRELYEAYCAAQSLEPYPTNTELPFNPAAIEAVDMLMITVHEHTKNYKGLIPGAQFGMMAFMGLIGNHDFSVTRSSQNAVQRYNTDRDLLNDVLTITTTLATLEKMSFFIVEDDLLTLSRTMIPGKPLQLWSVFVVQLFLDVRHCLGNRSCKGFEEMRMIADFVRSSLEKSKATPDSTDSVQWDEDFFNMTLSYIHTYLDQDHLQDTLRDAVSIPAQLQAHD